MKKRCLKKIATLGLILSWLILGGCGESRTPYAGTYRSTETFAGKGHVELVLKNNGEAEWTLAQEGKTLKLKWRVEESRIWLYTKEGGILIVTPSLDGKHLSADMSGEWHPGCPPDQCITFTRVKEGG